MAALAQTDAIRNTGGSPISPMVDMVNLQILCLCAIVELAMMVTILDGACHGGGP